VFANCPAIEFMFCHGIGHILEHCPMWPPKQNCWSFKSNHCPNIEGSTTITMSDIVALLKQVISSNTYTTISATHSNSQFFFFDSACCNHMTNDIKSLPSVTIVSSLPPIHTTNGNTMNILIPVMYPPPTSLFLVSMYMIHIRIRIGSPCFWC